MRYGPVLLGTPASCASADRTAALSGFNAADLEDGLARAFEQAACLGCPFRSENYRHSDPAVECPSHFSGIDPAAGLQHGKNRRELPSFDIDEGVATIGQNPWNIFKKSTAGDMCKALDLLLLRKR
jgi:hypothetical protein